MAHAGGRPTDYTPELAQAICDVIATCTESYDRMCEWNPSFPVRNIMRLWRYKHLEFKSMYEVARQAQADLYIDELREVARNRENDLMETNEGYKSNPAAVARDKLIIDTDKWIACKVLPKVYGDKSEVKSDITAHVTTHEDRLKELE